MSDSFEMLVDLEATPGEAEGVAQVVLDRFRELDLIAGEANSDCVLGGTGYRPGPAVADLYDLGERSYPFWRLVTCGVEPRIGRGFNEFALGESFEGYVCPACGAEFDPVGDAFDHAIADAIDQWLDESGSAMVSCPECREKRPVTEWQCKPPFGFGNVSFTFWNWPPLDSPSWNIDIAGIVRQVTGHAIVETHGHV
jgi:hypothetical protein